jgi:DNA-binding response OmpR family regulator
MAYRVFLADSSPSALQAMHLAFQDSNYDLYTSNEGGEVLDLIRQLKPDAIVLGLTLPHGDGYEIARALRDLPDCSQTPLILLRAAGEQLEENRLTGLDHAEIVSKPFDSEELAYKIRALISGTRDPESLPEEPEPVSSQSPPKKTSPASPSGELEAGGTIRGQIREEVLEMERELEKRVAARVKAELKAWLQFDQGLDSEKS